MMDLLLQYMEHYLEYIQNRLGEMVSQGIDADQLRRTCVELEEHMRLEDELVFPMLYQFDQASQVIDKLSEEHESMKALLHRIKEGGALHDVHHTLVQLLTLYQHHADRVENRIFPLIRQYLSPEQVNLLTEQYRKKELVIQHSA